VPSDIEDGADAGADAKEAELVDPMAPLDKLYRFRFVS
jgi:hypothetical protein